MKRETMLKKQDISGGLSMERWAAMFNHYGMMKNYSFAWTKKIMEATFGQCPANYMDIKPVRPNSACMDLIRTNFLQWREQREAAARQKHRAAVQLQQERIARESEPRTHFSKRKAYGRTR